MTQQPPGWDPYGQPQGGQQPYGQQPYGHGQQPYGVDPYGQPAPYGQQPTSYGEVIPYQAPGYQAPVYQPYGPTWAPGPQRKTNGLAIASMVVALAGLLFCVYAIIPEVVAFILGLVAKKQLKEKDQDGGGMATAGIVISSIVAGLSLLVIIGYAALVGGMLWFGSTATNP